jgi:nitrite reductase (NO-forming)
MIRNINRRTMIRLIGVNAALLGIAKITSWVLPESAQAAEQTPAVVPKPASVVANPINIPPPIHRNHAVHHDVNLLAQEVVGEIEPGATFPFMTFNGQVPGPMIRVREGDTVSLTLRSPVDNAWLHNVDLHAVYGTGGGAAATVVRAGKSKGFFFKAMYPGAFVYHCAIADMDRHISSGMYGMIVVEPKQGMAKVDREFYLGYNEVYTVEPFGKQVPHVFDSDTMARESPTYVLFNGAVNALTKARDGAMKARVGETVRVFLVNGGPNLTCSFHPIGNVWTKAWAEGALASEPRRYVQTVPVAPGSAFVGEMNLPLAETIKLVDHSLSRVVHKGAAAEIEVSGSPNPEIYRPFSPETPGH